MARRELFRRVATTDTELDTLEAHQAGNITEDVATELATTVLSRLEGQEKRELDEIEAALARLETGVFGVCDACHAQIPLTRLRAMPTARYCVTCQMRREA
jgi:RNA polymerase-binding transcription factor DksA